MPVRISKERLARVRTARDHLLKIVREKGRQAGGGWVSAGTEGFDIMHRTPFTKPMPKARQPATYASAFVRQHFATDLPYTMEVWYQRKKIMNVQWDDKDKIQLISFHPGVWEEKLATISEAG
jgi:hypothetical protein